MNIHYEKPNIEKIEIRPKKRILSGPEFAESSWTGSSCFKICRTKDREEKK